MTKAKEFEKQISRIYEVLEAGAAEVTWDEKMPDPDNPKQLRQIDITVKKNNHITHIECRSHKTPQGTQWIEELYGRKISLEANSMIAVSDSGFSEGAIKKANKLGIFIRSLSQLTKNEVTNWGSTTTKNHENHGVSQLDLSIIARWPYPVFLSSSLITFRSTFSRSSSCACIWAINASLIRT